MKIRILLSLPFLWLSMSSELFAQAPLEISLEGVNLSCEQSHPRLFLSDDDFKVIRKTVNSCKSKSLLVMHRTYIEYADESVNKDAEIEFKTNSSGKLLEVSRSALGQIGACAYAYRFTKDPKYAERVETILTQVCSFGTWNPTHYLDVAEMSVAVALGYDWCYSRLSKSTKELCCDAIAKYSFDTAEDETYSRKFRSSNNWGQVLNAGLICSAISFYENNPERSKKLIARAIRDNSDFVAHNYAPDGICPEGPGYWGYGTSAQMIINCALEHTYGTDFGLSDCPGFSESAVFITFATGASGEVFNFSDGGIKKSQPALWYFADKFAAPGLAYNEIKHIENNPEYKMRMRFGFLYVPYAARVTSSSGEAPDKLLYSGKGRNPVMMARTGWSSEDLYVAVKGGGAKNNHAHLDAGSFVFDAFGKRWICDPKAPKYAQTEAALRSIGASVWKMSQESMRWKIYGYNNHQHSTISINGADHLVTGKGELEDVWDEATRRGAKFGLTSLFKDQADSVSRTVCLVDNDHLEIVDYIRARTDKPAEVYTNYATNAQVTIRPDCIILTIDKEHMEIRADGATVTYSSGMVRPSGVPECLEPFYIKKVVRSAGVSYVVPPGESICVKTIIKKQ